MDEDEAEMLVLAALNVEKDKQIRFIKRVATEVYGFQGRMLKLLHDGKVDECIKILEEMREVYRTQILER